MPVRRPVASPDAVPRFGEATILPSALATVLEETPTCASSCEPPGRDPRTGKLRQVYAERT